MHVHLIDGTYELFRQYYGAPGASDPSGREVGATRGLLRSMLMLLTQPEVSHVAVAFDSEVESFRNALFDGYKTGEGIEPELFAQFPLAERAASALGMTVWPMREFEADDALATGAKRYAGLAGVDRVMICSADKDLAQCVVEDKIVCFDRMRDRVLDEAGVIDKFGVTPASIPDWLALVGDAADGIPGIPRWGAKSASTVLGRYRHITEIPADAKSWDVKVRGAAGLAENLNPRREEARLYRQLATLREDVPLEENLADLLWRGARRTQLTALCEELGMRPALLDRLTRWRD